MRKLTRYEDLSNKHLPSDIKGFDTITGKYNVNQDNLL